MAENDSEQQNESKSRAASRESAGRQPDAPRLYGPADEVEDNRSTAGKALESQIAPDAPARVETYNPGYSMADDDREGEESQFAVEDNDVSGFVGASPEYRTYANETEKPHDFEEVEGKAVDTLAEASDNSKIDPMPVQHIDTSGNEGVSRRSAPAKKTAAPSQ